MHGPWQCVNLWGWGHSHPCEFRIGEPNLLPPPVPLNSLLNVPTQSEVVSSSDGTSSMRSSE